MTNATKYRFGPCELDEARRSLTAHGQEIKVQPRVFDLLCYLVRHRERVVPKDELLEALWPGTVVVDNAVQRVVSLARSALADVGLADAVRTYPRHGYRFCLDNCDEATNVESLLAVAADAAEARAALERADWVGACELYSAAEAQAPLPGDDVEQWARAALCAGHGAGAISALERVVAARDAEDDTLGAARAALLLIPIRVDQRQAVLASGLLHRVSRYLEGTSASVERGHYAWMASRMALAKGDPEHALAMADEACNIGRGLREPEVECLGLVYRGHALIVRGHVTEGLAQHEEAAALIRVIGARSWVAGWALCSILYAARNRCDWVRAAQFADSFSDWIRESRMPAFPATCQLHRAAVMSMQGDLQNAETEVRSAATLLAKTAPWAEGDAYCVLGDIQLCLGDLEGAEASFRQAHALGWDPQPGLARLHLLTGQSELARRGLERALADTNWLVRERRGQLLCLLAQAAALSADLGRAREALQMLASDQQLLATEALKAQYFHAQAEMGIAEHDFSLASQKLRQAIRHWRELGCRVSEAEARLRLAECLLQEQDFADAELELHAVEVNFAPVIQAHRLRLLNLRKALANIRTV